MKIVSFYLENAPFLGVEGFRVRIYRLRTITQFIDMVSNLWTM